MGERRKYSDSDKAAALAALDANAGNVKRTSVEVGIPHKTLDGWAKGRGVVEEVAELRIVKRGEFSELLEEVARGLLAAIPGKIGDADLRSVSTALGITVDKMQLLRGEPTAITGTLSDDERVDRVAALLDRARARRDGQPTLRAVS